MSGEKTYKFEKGERVFCKKNGKFGIVDRFYSKHISSSEQILIYRLVFSTETTYFAEKSLISEKEFAFRSHRLGAFYA